MEIDRRAAILGSLALAAAAHPLTGCSAAPTPRATKLYVMGTIHSNHLESERYSLDVLRTAIRTASPDIILTEIPPDRIDQAIASFQSVGEIDEPRTQVFPEYTCAVFPLSREMGFEIRGTAGWTRDIADNRREALIRIQSDQARAQQWAEHRAAQRNYSREIAGRGDDPRFIHTEEFDRIVEASRRPYEQNFDADLGQGGWTQINAAHTELINSALDDISGQGLTALVTFGTAHKYKILRGIRNRDDIELQDTRSLFS
jgi:hypothetical protein